MSCYSEYSGHEYIGMGHCLDCALQLVLALTERRDALESQRHALLEASKAALAFLVDTDCDGGPLARQLREAIHQAAPRPKQVRWFSE